MDYDGDGDLDILSGSYTGEVYLFVRDDDGTFQQGVFLKNHDGGPLQTGTSITPEAHDLDGDGDLDLLIGTRSDGVFWHENLGSRTEPSIAATGTPLKTKDGKPIQGSNAHFADWDQDGVRDLVLGSEGGAIVWHKNLGTDTKPEFAAAKQLVGRADNRRPRRDQLPSHPGMRTKVHVGDWNGDGRVDLLVGDVTWHQDQLPPLSDEQAAEEVRLKPLYEKAKKTYNELWAERRECLRQEKPISSDLQQKFDEVLPEYERLRKRINEFRRSQIESRGYVWVYLREGDSK